MSNSKIVGKLPTYQQIIDNLAAAEQLEWEATNFNDMAENRKAHLNYFALGGIVTVMSVFFAALLDVFSGFSADINYFYALAGLAVLGTGVAIFATQSRSLRSLFEEAKFRRKLALELIRPVRDVLYLAAEEYEFSDYQLTSLQIRLSRFPIEEPNRLIGESSHE